MFDPSIYNSFTVSMLLSKKSILGPLLISFGLASACQSSLAQSPAPEQILVTPPPNNVGMAVGFALSKIATHDPNQGWSGAGDPELGTRSSAERATINITGFYDTYVGQIDGNKFFAGVNVGLGQKYLMTNYPENICYSSFANFGPNYPCSGQYGGQGLQSATNLRTMLRLGIRVPFLSDKVAFSCFLGAGWSFVSNKKTLAEETRKRPLAKYESFLIGEIGAKATLLVDQKSSTRLFSELSLSTVPVKLGLEAGF